MAINLYKVTVGHNDWYYTSGEFDISGGVNSYTAVPIKRTDLTFELSQSDMTVTAPANLPPFDLLKYSVPLIPFTLEVLNYPSMAPAFKGNVLGASFDGVTNLVKVKVGSSTTLDGTTAPARMFGTTCSYELFSEQCGLNSEDFKILLPKDEITIDGVTMEHTSFGLAGNYFYSGGYLEADNGESQYITKQVGNIITLMGGLMTLEEISTINFYPGCNKSHVTCDTKFSNQRVFGGFPYIPMVNIVSEGF